MMKNNTRLFALVWTKQRAFLIQLFIYQITVHTIGFIGNVLVLKYVIEQMEAEGADRIQRILLAIVLFASYTFAIHLFWSYFQEIGRRRSREQLHCDLSKEIYARVRSVPLEQYENPSFYNRLLMVTEQMEDRIDLLLDTVTDSAGCVVTLVLTGSVVFSIDAPSMLMAVLSVVLTALLQRAINQRKEQIISKENQWQKNRMYYMQCYYLKESLHKLKLCGSGHALKEENEENHRRYVRDTTEDRRHLGIMLFAQKYIPGYLILQIGLCAWLSFCVLVRQSLSLAEFVAVWKGIDLLVTNLEQLFGACAGHFKESGIYASAFFSFMDEEITGEPEDSEAARTQPEMTSVLLSTEHLRYAYPGGYQALSGIGLTIRQGEKIAIVGHNGSGKTTLALLLARLYTATEGRISLCGRVAEDVPVQTWRERFDILFQDYSLFEVSVAENVAMRTRIDEAQVRAALEDADVPFLTEDLDKQVGREFSEDGWVLSGGQQLRMGMARVLYSNRDILILDEPSASLDALEERHFNEWIRNKTEDRTVIFISHRLSTIRLADRIYCMEQGRIVEEGTHEALLKKNGPYAQMWRIQAD
ncbi:MAG: ABC transporter ATP-binding protein [Butyrivibrio sp.]|nr:ABC transporter ATP-binding protein [Butyrivibrio sp.]